eukprot:12408931-Karenia_brevis.AAC.1
MNQIDQKSIQKQSQIHQKSIKICLKLVLEAVWGLLGGLLGPSWPQEGPKSQQDPQNSFVGLHRIPQLGAMLEQKRPMDSPGRRQAQVATTARSVAT